jgi:hypothetical protein
MTETIILDLNTVRITMADFERFVWKYRADHPGTEIWMDGDRNAIIARRDAA